MNIYLLRLKCHNVYPNKLPTKRKMEIQRGAENWDIPNHIILFEIIFQRCKSNVYVPYF